MVKSMTGFGRASSGEDSDKNFSIEIKSVNHRYLDINIKMPKTFVSLEEKIRRLISERLSRGKVDVFINHNGVILDNVVQKIYDLGANIYHIDIAQDKEFISDYIKSNYIKLVYSGGSNHFNKSVMDIVDYVDENIKLAVSNNNLICCGEGICGACSIDLNGVKVKTCKTQVNSREYLKSI